MRLLAVVLTSLVACGGSAKQPATPADPIPKTAGPSCKQVAEHMATLADRAPTDDTGKLAEPLRTQCEHDGWGDDARSCFATAQSDAELDGCKGMLTDLQRKSFPQAAPAAAAPAPAVEEEESAPAPKHNTRGPVQKKKAGKTSDPCEGGE